MSIAAGRPKQPLRTILRNTIDELVILKGRLETVEDEMDGLLTRRDLKLPSSTIAILQELDISTQSLNAVIAFLTEISGTLEHGDEIDIQDAMSHILLRDMAQRMLTDAQHANTDLAHPSRL